MMFWMPQKAGIERLRQQRNSIPVSQVATGMQDRKREMTSSLFKTMRTLEEARLHFSIERTRPDSVRFAGINGRGAC
jgi:hypothetical protein